MYGVVGAKLYRRTHLKEINSYMQRKCENISSRIRVQILMDFKRFPMRSGIFLL